MRQSSAARVAKEIQIACHLQRQVLQSGNGSERLGRRLAMARATHPTTRIQRHPVRDRVVRVRIPTPATALRAAGRATIGDTHVPAPTGSRRGRVAKGSPWMNPEEPDNPPRRRDSCAPRVACRRIDNGRRVPLGCFRQPRACLPPPSRNASTGFVGERSRTVTRVSSFSHFDSDARGHLPAAAHGTRIAPEQVVLRHAVSASRHVNHTARRESR